MGWDEEQRLTYQPGFKADKPQKMTFMTYTAIAKELGITKNGVRAIEVRALKKLKKYIEEK